ncbi:MAG: hypothetical protein KJ709_09715 [Nanoarchaeota archaeon]|nr:hypothetical protein [Nanoarchaeota archaeon]
MIHLKRAILELKGLIDEKDRLDDKKHRKDINKKASQIEKDCSRLMEEHGKEVKNNLLTIKMLARKLQWMIPKWYQGILPFNPHHPELSPRTYNLGVKIYTEMLQFIDKNYEILKIEEEEMAA